MARYHRSGCAVVWSRRPDDPVGTNMPSLAEVMDAIAHEFPGCAYADLEFISCGDALVLAPRNFPAPAVI